MGSMARKLKRQQPMLKAPYAKSIPEPTPEFKAAMEGAMQYAK